jgi:predicted enzyme related to lactoylglutathione lyase
VRRDRSQPIVYFEIIGADGELLRSYYSGLVDWQFEFGATRRGFHYALLRADGVGIEGAVGTAPPGTGGYVTFYVAIADVESDSRARSVSAAHGSSAPTG